MRNLKHGNGFMTTVTNIGTFHDHFAHWVHDNRHEYTCTNHSLGRLPYDRSGDARGKFWIKPLKETNLGVAQPFVDP